MKGEEEMVTKTKVEGKRLPGTSTIGRFPHVGLKDVILAQPICPNSQIRGRMVDGHYEPPVVEPGQTNCQVEGGQWWKRCEERGHDPYWSTREWVVTKTRYEVDAEGDKVPIEKRVVVSAKQLNTTSVSTSLRIGSGQAVRWKKRYFGYRPISDFGYAEACHLSRCQEPATTVVKPYGSFCSLTHAERAAADDNGILLTRTDHEFVRDPEDRRKFERRRKRQLRNAVDDIDIMDVDTATGRE